MPRPELECASEAEDDDNEQNACEALAGGSTVASDGRQFFTMTFNHRYDWLHRGKTLRNMDYYHYARYIDRAELPRAGDALQFQARVGVYHYFDAHYVLAATHVQVLRAKAKTVQNMWP